MQVRYKGMPVAATLLLVSLTACAPALPRAPTPPPIATLPPKERLVSAIEANGCLLTASNVGAILLRANLTQEQLLAIAPELAAEGRAEVAADGAIRVLTDNCI